MPETWLDQLLYMVILVLKILAIVVPLILAVAYYTYFERKVIGYMQIRRGPNRIGPLGLAQPFADVFKLLLKEIILPENCEQIPVPAGAGIVAGPGVCRLGSRSL